MAPSRCPITTAQHRAIANHTGHSYPTMQETKKGEYIMSTQHASYLLALQSGMPESEARKLKPEK